MSGKREVPDVADVSAPADNKAVAESQAFATDVDLEKIERRHAHERRESFRKHFHWALLILFWGFFGTLTAAGIIWAYHLLTPEDWHFLTAQQLSKIESTFFSGILAGGLSMAMKAKYFD